MTPNDLIPLKEAAALLGVSRQRVSTLIANGRLTMIYDRGIKLSRAQVLAFERKRPR